MSASSKTNPCEPASAQANVPGLAATSRDDRASYWAPAVKPTFPQWRLIAGLMLLAAVITWAMPADMVLGAPHTDLINQFAAMRAFAADSIRAGDFPFWNPHTYAGQPFLGATQSGLLYPPNVLYLFLPLSRAINFSILLHLLVAGWGMSFWLSQRRLHPVAATLTGGVLALSGPVLPHVYAGHLSNLCTLAWVPWAFAGIELWRRQQSARGLLVASGAVALQILGGQMQYVFFFGVAAAVYAVVQSASTPAARSRLLPALVGCVLLGSFLAAAQLVPGWAAASESVRSGKLSYDFAATFSLPPENLITTVVPTLFGDDPRRLPYWGRCYPWEMSLFVGVAAVGFAALGLLSRQPGDGTRRDLIVALVLVAFALGSHLPAYRVLYDHVPGFDRFRGMSKFTFPAILFVLLLTARGIDAFVRGRARVFPVGVVAIAVGLMLGSLGLYVRGAPDLFTDIVAALRAEPENDFPARWYAADDFVARAARQAAWALGLAAATAVAFGVCLLLARRGAVFRIGAMLLIPLELAAFAMEQTATTSLSLAAPDEVRRAIAENPGDYRVLNLLRPNNGYLVGAPDLWGNDPLVLRRYAEFMAFTQKRDPARATQNLTFETLHPLFAMLRGRFAFSGTASDSSRAEFHDVLPRALLVADYRVRVGRESVFAELARDDFNPAETVILESEPGHRPGAAPAVGNVRVLAATADSLDLEVATPTGAILLVTDLFSSGWRVKPLGASPQTRYELMPANYVLRAVPLAAGTHQLRMEYIAPGFAAGLAISAVALVGWIAAWVYFARRQRRSHPAILPRIAETAS